MPSTWDEQDSAFFGDLGNGNRKPSADEELANKLQKQFLEEQNAQQLAEQRDKEFAQKLERTGSARGAHNMNVARGSSTNRNTEQERKDAALARALHEEESKNGGSHQNNGGGAFPGTRRRYFRRNSSRQNSDQEDKDAALARALHEEEQKQMSPLTVPASPHGSFPSQKRGFGGLGGLVPKCVVCNQVVLMPFSALGNLYHAECFKCMGCHGSIRPGERFAYIQGDDGIKHPLHRHCYAELYGLRCTVCHHSMEADASGRVSYMKHPFFDNEYMCPKHTADSIRRCTGCYRFEPVDSPFANMNDANRCVCDSCLRSVIVDSDDAKPLWNSVLQFFEQNLKLPIWSSMRQIPILIVGHDALNGQMQANGQHGLDGGSSSQLMTRGLCLSEHQRGHNFLLPRMRFDRKQSTFLPSDANSEGYTFFRIPDASKSNPNASVTAILCLSGLPADLTASILAHEATHAWIKLHPQYDVSRSIPSQVEEGCCQLMAMLFLTDGLPPLTDLDGKGSGGGPSDKRLRQYFKFAIETDPGEVYGEGYRKAALAYSKIGLEALLSHVVTYQEFPNI